MTALIFIIGKSVRNGLKELLRKPAKLTLYLVVLAVIAGIIAMSFFPALRAATTAPIFWFSGILFLFVTLFVVFAVVKGLSNGDTIFEMNDVNLLFVSPISPRKILLYGIARTAKASFFASFFILFQANSLANFGINYGGVLLTLAWFILSMVVLSVLSLLIYSTTNGQPRRKLIVKVLTALLFLPFTVFAAVQYFLETDIAHTLEVVINSPFMAFIPVAGWTAAGVTGFLSGSMGTGLLFLGLTLLLGGGLVAYLLLSNLDYYEDVLVATETAYEKKRALAEGNIGGATASNKRVRIRRTGIPFGGAAALFGKHLRESFRENRLGFITLPTMLIIPGAIIMSLIIGDIIIVLQILMWGQIFLIGTGRGMKELSSHYIYMIPESSFSKILWSNMEIMARTLIESAVIFGISGLLLQSPFTLVLACGITHILFSLLLLGINLVFMRFTGANLSSGMLIMIYFFSVMLVMAPGITLAIVASILGGTAGYLTGLLVLCGWELTTGLLCFAFSSSVLHNCDIAVLPAKT